ncbi:hypothetical protein AVEN_230355-1 [Araneus ventricosus]|uniref:Zinc finger BED domain-containing protein 5 n=1 Tax=Araneus ventricosus TaxID=182803 RepID=A0A4Y2I5U6_ARAVE|nr:hypothetical protein AVEN_230355-1 [Araneus ventricosus]
MQKVNEIFGFLSPKQLTTLDNKTLREEAATTLANLYPHDLEKDELDVEIESFNAKEDKGVTAAAQAGFSDESLTADATELLDLELSNKLHSSTSSDTSSTIKKILKRKYHDSYLDIGFAETTDNKPQCVICVEVFPNSSMFPAKMRRHFEGVHPE